MSKCISERAVAERRVKEGFVRQYVRRGGRSVAEDNQPLTDEALGEYAAHDSRKNKPVIRARRRGRDPTVISSEYAEAREMVQIFRE